MQSRMPHPSQPRSRFHEEQESTHNPQSHKMNPRIHGLKELLREIRELFPEARYISMSTRVETEGADVIEEISLHLHNENNTYAKASQLMRDLGIEDREKHVYDTYTQLDGEVDGVKVTTFPDELPPTCRKVTITEKIPKTQTVDTGEFIEVTKTIIQCGEEREVA